MLTFCSSLNRLLRIRTPALGGPDPEPVNWPRFGETVKKSAIAHGDREILISIEEKISDYTRGTFRAR